MLIMQLQYSLLSLLFIRATIWNGFFIGTRIVVCDLTHPTNMIIYYIFIIYQIKVWISAEDEIYSFIIYSDDMILLFNNNYRFQ